MSVSVTCPSCRCAGKAPDNAAGKKVKCPKCGAVLSVPAATSPPPPPRLRPLVESVREPEVVVVREPEVVVVREPDPARRRRPTTEREEVGHEGDRPRPQRNTASGRGRKAGEAAATLVATVLVLACFLSIFFSNTTGGGRDQSEEDRRTIQEVKKLIREGEEKLDREDPGWRERIKEAAAEFKRSHPE